jgi:NADH dehydrogenase
MSARPHVVIVGGGFGGLYAARALRRAPVRITLVDRRNHHVFQPLLYQVATAALSPSEIAAPIRAIVSRQKNVTVLMAEARSVDVERRRLILADGELDYDQLVVATGATHSYFGHDEWARFAPGLKTLEDALEMRRRVLLAYEAAEREPDEALRREWLTFVIVGGGPTGVELAGALGEIARHAMRRDFRHIDPSQARVILVEAMDRVLPPYPPSLSAKAERSLARLGVEIRKQVRVTAIDEHGVSFGDERLPARTVLWAAGVAASPLARSLGAPLDKAGRVLVGPRLTVPGHDEIYVIGDLAHLEQDGVMVPGVAPAAMQMGNYVAGDLRRALRGRERPPFRYFEKGTFAVIGRGAAVGMPLGKVKVSGFFAWLAWLFIHIFFLIGFRNRVLVLFGWAYSYLTFRRGARLITGESGPPAISDGSPRALPPA